MSTTKIIKIDPENPEPNYVTEAADIIRSGGLAIIPTETVYGIAANMLNKQAVDRLYKVKQRPENKLFSVHIAGRLKMEEFARSIPVSAYKLADKFWPGPLTMILKSKDNATVGLRMPDNPTALAIIRESGVPVVCPSANLSGKPAPGNFGQALEDLNGLVDLAIDGGETKLGVESSVVDLTGEQGKVVREGAIKKEEIEAELNKKAVLFVCTGNSCRSVMAEALLKKKMLEKGRGDVEVFSAGLMMMGGLGATASTRELLMWDGMDVSQHSSKRITSELIKKSDFILVMERLHEEGVLRLAPEVRNRVFLLKEFAKISNGELNIPDPIGRPVEFYEKTYTLIKDAIERISNII